MQIHRRQIVPHTISCSTKLQACSKSLPGSLCQRICSCFRLIQRGFAGVQIRLLLQLLRKAAALQALRYMDVDLAMPCALCC